MVWSVTEGGITFKITPCWVTLLQPARRDAVLDQPSSLRPHWVEILAYFLTVYCVLYVGVDFDGLMEMAEGFTLG